MGEGEHTVCAVAPLFLQINQGVIMGTNMMLMASF